MVTPFLEQGRLHPVEGGQPLRRPLYLAYLEKSERRELIDALLTLPLGWDGAELYLPTAD